MKIFFDKNKNDSSEIKEVVGFGDADIPIVKLWSYLKTASREIFNIIGKENYEMAEAEYLAQQEQDYEANEALSELLELIQHSVALDAFRKFQPLNDVSYTNDGRLFRRDDHHAAAFEWMIDNSDNAMERRYYESVDELISFIVDEESLSESEFMISFSGLYVPNLKEFQKYVDINNSHLLYFKLAPEMRLCEQREIINRLGDQFLEIKNSKESNHIHIRTLVQCICVYYAMKNGIQKFSVQLFPEGLMKPEIHNKKTATGYDKESITLHYEKELNSLYKSLEIEVKKLNSIYSTPRRINFDECDGFVTTS